MVGGPREGKEYAARDPEQAHVFFAEPPPMADKAGHEARGLLADPNRPVFHTYRLDWTNKIGMHIP